MGVKAIKEKYKIEHIVQRRGDVIWIGAPLHSEIIGINMDGKIIKYYKNLKYNDGWSTNEDLKRYQEELLIDEGDGTLKNLVQQEDNFKELKPVFQIEDGRVIELFCEEYGWPNVCTNGEIQYEGTFFEDYQTAYKELLTGSKSNVKYSWKNFKRNFSEHFNSIKRNFSMIFSEIKHYIYARTIQRVKGFKHNKNKNASK